MLETKGLSKSFGRVNAVNNVSLEIPSGSTTIILGPSGSGKTTLLRLIAGLEIPDRGEIYFEGKPLSSPSSVVPPSKRNLGFVFQTPSLWPHMTVVENIIFGLQGLPASEVKLRLQKLIEILYLKEFINRYPHQISGGEARRASIARTLAPDPQYILMDEPLTNMDYDLKMKILDVIRNTADRDKTSLIYVTHQIEEADLISGRVLVMEKGKLKL